MRTLPGALHDVTPGCQTRGDARRLPVSLEMTHPSVRSTTWAPSTAFCTACTPFFAAAFVG